MTHDELLVRIAKLSITPETNVVPSELATALMAVVELHTAGNGESARCESCWLGFPCPTIEAIEKELG